MVTIPSIVSEQQRFETHPHGTIFLHFNDDTFDRSSMVDHASLKILLPAVRDAIITRIQIHQVMSNGRSKKRYLIDSKIVYLSDRNSKWCEFDVSSAVNRWISYDEEILYLVVRCPRCNQRGYNVTPVEAATINLLLNADSTRDKRSSKQEFYYRKDRKTDCRKESKKCCRQEMNFDLEKLGFSFIIQPKKFDAGICKGRCPPYYNAAHNHAMLQGIMWKKNKTATPRVCCAPSKLTHLEVLTVDEEDPTKLAVRDLANMIVLECACS